MYEEEENNDTIFTSNVVTWFTKAFQRASSWIVLLHWLAQFSSYSYDSSNATSILLMKKLHAGAGERDT